LARYTAVVLGAVGASLCAAWPFLPGESRLAVLTGALLAAANTICAYFLARWSAGRANQAFFTAVLGGMLARMTVLLCLWLGHSLDKKFGTEPRYFLVGALVGVVAAFLHFWHMYKTMTGGKK
jgi:hypothetical protein